MAVKTEAESVYSAHVNTNVDGGWCTRQLPSINTATIQKLLVIFANFSQIYSFHIKRSLQTEKNENTSACAQEHEQAS